MMSIFSSSRSKKIIVIIGVGVFLILCWNFFNNYREMQRLQQEINYMQEQIDRTKAENNMLRQELEKVDDDEYIEEIARERLGLVKPGETLLIPVEEE